MRLRIMLVLVCVMACWAMTAAQQSTVTGTITFPERAALPSVASVEVTLEDVSRADAPTTVIARVQTPIGAGPIPFDLIYDPNRIEPSHRYAVTARTVDDGTTPLATSQAALVITQGHSSRVSLLLRPAGADRTPPRSRRSVAAAGLPRRPAVELADLLPAKFVGTTPCADCAGVQYELELMADDGFVLRRTYLGKDGSVARDLVGSWALSSDHRALTIEGEDGSRDSFAITSAATLRALDADGHPITGPRSYELRLSEPFVPIAFKGTVLGAYRESPGGATFTPCASGQVWNAADGGAAAALGNAYRNAGRKAPQPLLVRVSGHLTDRSSVAFAVDDVTAVLPSASCAPRFAMAPLEETTWNLVWVAGTPVPAAAPATAPTLTFRRDSSTFSANGGCNRLAGRFEARGASLAFATAGTLTACPGSAGSDSRLKAVLANTRMYRILGHSLELYDDQGKLVARFEG